MIPSWGFQTIRSPWAIFEFQKLEGNCSFTSVRLQRLIEPSGLSWIYMIVPTPQISCGSETLALNGILGVFDA